MVTLAPRASRLLTVWRCRPSLDSSGRPDRHFTSSGSRHERNRQAPGPLFNASFDPGRAAVSLFARQRLTLATLTPKRAPAALWLRVSYGAVQKFVHAAGLSFKKNRLWIEQTEGTKFWLKVMNELKTRGVGDILIAVVDGLARGAPSSAS